MANANNQGIGPWEITETDPYLINEVFRQIEEQINRLRGLGLPISIVVHTHKSNAQGGKLDHGAALTGLLDNDHPQYLLATAVTTDERIEEATSHDRVSDQVMVGTGLTLTEQADGSGDAVQLAVDSTVITTTNTDWVDLTDGGATTLHSHGAATETDQALYDATTAEHITDEVFTDDTLTLVELADGSGDAIALGIQPSLLVDQAPQDHISDQVMVDATLTLTELADASGDAIQLKLTDTAVTPGTYGDASNVSQITVDQQGRLTSATNVAIVVTATEANDVGFIDANDSASRIVDQIVTGQDLTLVELAEGSGDAIQLDVNSIALLDQGDTPSTDNWERVIDGLADSSVSIDSTGRLHVAGINEFRHLQSAAVAVATANQTGNAVNAWATRNFGGEDFDTDSIHSTSSNTSRLTAQVAGKYLVTASLYIDATSVTAPAFMAIRVLKNGGTGTAYFQNLFPNTINTALGISTAGIINLVATDYIEVQGIVLDSAGTFDLGDTLNITRFGMCYIGE